MQGLDQRSKNRLREHGKPGHGLATVPNPHATEDGKLFRCNCGWFGWLKTKD